MSPFQISGNKLNVFWKSTIWSYIITSAHNLKKGPSLLGFLSNSTILVVTTPANFK